MPPQASTKLRRDDPDRPATTGPGLHAGQPIALGDQLEGVHVQEQTDIGGSAQLAAIGRGEVGGPAMAIADRLDHALLPRLAARQPRPVETPISRWQTVAARR